MNRSFSLKRECKNSIILLTLLMFAVFLAQGQANATATENTDNFYKAEIPQKVLLYPKGGRLEGQCEAKIESIDGNTYLASFILPGNAENINIVIPGYTLARWSYAPVLLYTSSDNASRRQRTEERKLEISAQLQTIKTRIELWTKADLRKNEQYMEQFQSSLQSSLPELIEEQEKLENQLKIVQEELQRLPGGEKNIGVKITMVLSNKSKNGNTTSKSDQPIVKYSYDFQDCGWQAVYDFDAVPNEKGDMIHMRFLADVWQYSGVDWKNAEITLATRGGGPREPLPLSKWIVGSGQPRSQRVEARSLMNEGRAMAVQEDSEMSAIPVPPVATVKANTNSLYATWTLEAIGLPDGQSHLVISTDDWKTPLQWLARPTKNDNRVWLYAKYELPGNQAWPQGTAHYSVNGQNIGQGVFKTSSGEVTLYFGADPRIHVRTTVDSSKQGETGIITTNKTWTGAWTYTIDNQHTKAIKVRLERPMPMVTNENITVTYKDNPPSTRVEKEHMLYWMVDVPSRGKASVEHSITITSPAKLPLFPDVP